MAASIKHKFVSPIGDGSDTSQVRPSNWNAEHELSGVVVSVDGTLPDALGDVTTPVKKFGSYVMAASEVFGVGDFDGNPAFYTATDADGYICAVHIIGGDRASLEINNFPTFTSSVIEAALPVPVFESQVLIADSFNNKSWKSTFDFASSVNGVVPDNSGNVILDLDGKVKSVNNEIPDLAGNITVNVDGKVKTVNNVSPDINGNITITFTMPLKYEFLARKSSAQSMAAGSTVKLTYATMDIGTASYYSTANSRFTAPAEGLYEFTVHLGLSSGQTGRLYLYKNGVAMNVRIDDHSATTSSIFKGSIIMVLVANDYVEAWGRTDAAASSDTDCSYFMGHRLT